MTDLQTIFNNLVFIIVSYVATQKGQESTSQVTFENLMEKPHKELISDLTDIINEIKGSKYEARIPLMNYLLEVINQLKPLTDEKTALTVHNIDLIQEDLITLITNLQDLMNRSHNDKIAVEYNGNEFVLYGFTRALWSQCYSSQVLTKNFLSLFNIDSQTDKTKIEAIIEKFLKSYKQLALAEEKIADLTAQVKVLTEGKQEQKLKIGVLKQEIIDLKKNNDCLGAENNSIQIEMKGLVESNKILQTENDTLSENNKKLQAQKKGLIEENEKLRKQSNSLATGNERNSQAPHNPSFFSALQRMYPGVTTSLLAGPTIPKSGT